MTKREFLLTSIVAICINAFHFATGSLFRKPNLAPTAGTSDYVDGRITGAFTFSRWLNAEEVSKLYRGEVVHGGTIINAEQ